MVDEAAEGGMERFAREDVLAALARFGATRASRATTTDSTEEVILLAKADFESVDVRELTFGADGRAPAQEGLGD